EMLPGLEFRRVLFRSQLSRQLLERGAEVLEVPTIKLEPPTRREDVVDALLELNAYDWLVFTSPNGVTTFFGYFFKRFHDMRDLGDRKASCREGVKIAL